jgi:hypothetical protein
MRGDATGPNCGPLLDAEKAEIDTLSIEQLCVIFA